MKKIYTLIITILVALAANAQCIPDNTLNQPGYYPEELDTAKLDQAYHMVLQVRIPPDTNVMFGSQKIKADIDSIRLISVDNLPNGFTYVCNVPTCTFTPHQTYCVVLQGNPTIADQGTYHLLLNVRAYAHGNVFGTPTTFPPQDDVIDRFTLVVGNGVSTLVKETDRPQPVQLYPNPARTEVNLLLNGNAGEAITYTLCDITGKTILQNQTTLSAEYGFVTLPLHGIAQGLYMVQVTGAKGTAATRLVVE